MYKQAYLNFQQRKLRWGEGGRPGMSKQILVLCSALPWFNSYNINIKFVICQKCRALDGQTRTHCSFMQLDACVTYLVHILQDDRLRAQTKSHSAHLHKYNDTMWKRISYSSLLKLKWKDRDHDWHSLGFFLQGQRSTYIQECDHSPLT